ncbi:hypothetical protein JWJ90_17980 [Desulfobulbus rhabdoformis]|uniref:hypothetical protein n=1 Tax=Desulfobulbus rhabdoformis TaxID=34032 RepID=UPI0019646D0F|nr:hypothetical protein [Desulfobulbus rhabdoformis]MBM9616161.1 hypothetical protein [Desulfobulbus rhabdoformis]
MSYELSYFSKGFHLCFHGDVSIDEINSANGAIQGHNEFDDHRYQLVDFLDADLSSVIEEDGEFPAVTDSVASQTTQLYVKVAFVVQESYAIDIVKSYVNYARQLVPKWHFGVFSSRASALRWVNNSSLASK